MISALFISCNLTNGISYKYSDLEFDSEIWKNNKETEEDLSLYNKENERGKMFDSLTKTVQSKPASLKAGMKLEEVIELLGEPEKIEETEKGDIYSYYLGVWGVFNQHDFLTIVFKKENVLLFFLKRENVNQ